MRLLRAVLPFTVGLGLVGEHAISPVSALAQVREVRNEPSAGWAVGQSWRVNEELRIGSLLSGGPTEFGEISSLAVDGRGRIYVAEFLAQEVRVFHPSGDFAYTMGGKGLGPGEFGRVRGLAIDDATGNVWVLDIDPARLSVFSESGDFLQSYRRSIRGSIVPWPGRYLAGVGILDWALDRPRGANGRPGAHASLIPTLFAPPDETKALPPVEVELETDAAGEPKLLNRSSTQTVGADGRIWFAETDTYRVYGRTLTGDTIGVFSLATTPKPHDVDSIRLAFQQAGRQVDASSIFPTERVVTRLLVDDDGHIVVVPNDRTSERGTALDVFREDGRYLGRVSLPERIETQSPMPVLVGHVLYAVVRDDYDVPYVVRWRLTGA